MTKTIKIASAQFLALIVITLAVAVESKAQDDTTRVAYYTGRSIRYHPDGTVGSVSFHGLMQYGLVNAYPKEFEMDFQRYEGELAWVVDDYVNLTARFQTVDQDSLRYELSGGLKIYLTNPISTQRDKNADGPVGSPVISLAGGIRYPDLSISDTRAVGDAAILVPLSLQFTVLAGYRFFEEIEQFDVVQGYGGFNIYLSPYSSDSAYVNPDGPTGKLALKLLGGGSSKGVFGDLMLLFPISDKLTWRLNVRGERTESPYRRTAIAGAGFSYYPAN
ncbi:MAG: hypothetical protein JSU74_00070 [Candidatus Zixiibacteriota bacterium]|nr:MAG: hypothetical protein JSU74_00070 [candidate division Zixibacteria bacterium]